MEHIENSKPAHENVEKTGIQPPERTESQQQQQSTPKTPQQQRQAPVSHVPGTGTAKKGPATPRSRNTKASQGSTGSQRSCSSPPLASRGHKRSVTALRTFDQIQAEHLYLFSNLQQQEARLRTLVAALATVQSQLQLPSTTAEARRLRKNAGFIKSKIADAEQQERLALLGLGHVGAELQSRYRHLQLQQHLHEQQQHILAHAPTQAARFYEPVQGETHYPMQPQTPYLVPLNGPANFFPESYAEAHGPVMHDPSMRVITPISPCSWPESSGGGMAESMSPMSPLAPVFQPGASLFFGHTGANDGTDAVVADAADNNDNNDDAANDAAARQDSLGGTTCTGEGDEKAGEKDERVVDFPPRSVPRVEDATAMYYVLDTNENSDTGVNGDGDDATESMPRQIRLRRGSHDGKQQQQKPLTSAREKRMSLPPVRFSWPEKD